MTPAEQIAYNRGYKQGLKRANESREYVGIVGIIVRGNVVRARIMRNGARMYQMREQP